MALITSAATGNFSAGATWTGGVVPGVNDEARASTGHTITIDVNTTCNEISNDGSGIFTLASGVTLTANVTHKSTTNSRNCLQFTAASPSIGYIVGNCTGGTAQVAVGVVNTSSGTLFITGNCVGGSGSSGGANLGACGANNNSTGSITVTGNCTGGSGPSSHGVQNGSTGSVTVTGNCTGGTSTGVGAYNHTTGTITVTGNCTGGSSNASAFGSLNAAGGTITINGISTGGTTGSPAGTSNSSTGTIILTRSKGNAYGPGNTSNLAASVGASNAGLGIIEIRELEYGAYGMSPTSGTGIRLKKLSSNVAVFNYVDSGSAKTLVDATQGSMPAEADVRSGVSYASGALTGTCAVPAAASVAYGVAVGATTGTAYLSQSDVLAAVWGAATSSLTTAGSIGDRLKNSATVATTGEQLATALTAP